MSDSTKFYICIDCEITSDNTDPVTLNEHSLCSRCGSSSVVPVDSLLELVRRDVAKKQAPPHTSLNEDATRLQVQLLRDRRKRDSRPLVEFLKRRFPLEGRVEGRSIEGRIDHSVLHKVLDNWDGWAYHIHYPWAVNSFDEIDDSPCPGSHCIELINGYANAPRWVIRLDVTLVEVRQIVP